MRERISRLSKGMIDGNIPVLKIVPASIEEQVRAGETTKREFKVISENNIHIKGLVYSSNPRVKVLTSAFGGIRNSISYEINSRYLEHGDEIKGSFYLVTNGGEKEIPYLLRAELGNSGKTLGELETAEDFARIAREDQEMALRLFEYQDFTEAPFMQKLHVRAMYDGLKGHPNRQNLMEEFLVGLHVKNPVTISVDTEDRVFEDVPEPVSDKIHIRKEGWGYLCIEAHTEDEFIELPKKTLTDQDFVEDRAEFAFTINPRFLHRGRNFGCITLSTARETYTIKIEAVGDETIDISGGDLSGYKEGYRNYLIHRLDYECGVYEPALLLNKMLHELELMREEQVRDDMILLLQAELYILSDRREQAVQVIEECRDSVLAAKKDQVETYCLYQYLQVLLYEKDSQRDALLRLLHKCLDEKTGHFYLFFLLLKLDSGMYENPGILYSRMKKMYQGGCCSPFLYAQLCKLLNQTPGLLHVMDSFELQALYFGAKRNMLDEKLALDIADLAVRAKKYHKLYAHLLVTLYEKYPKKELLEAVCCMLIRGNSRDQESFAWYEKGLEEHISLTRLYEYYLYALPKNYDHALPREILLYFSYDKELDRHSKSVLYKNIVQFQKPDSSIYKDYERNIEQFTMEQLFDSRINSRLVTLYEHMIYKDMIDIPMAVVLPAILKSYRVVCDNHQMKYAIVRYEDLQAEDAFPLQDGMAFVPLFSENSVLLFQDEYGNRYTNVSYVKAPMMDQPELEQRCYEVYPDHPMLRLLKCRELVEHGITDDEGAVLLEKVLAENELQPLYSRRMTSRIIEYFQKATATSEFGAPDTNVGYLLSLDKKKLTRDERREICETLIAQNYIREAYDMIEEFGCDGLRMNRLMKLCTKMILQRMFDQDEKLLKFSYQVFAAGKQDSIILDYLSEHYNGTVDQMYRLLIQSVQEHVETYDLEERLTAQMMFTGDTDRIDRVFDLYASRKKTSELIVRAYFTVKCADYFLKNAVTGEKVFAYLEGAVYNTVEKEKVPTLYLMALTKYYASCKTLSDDQRELCRSVADVLIQEQRVFPCMKSLAKYIAIPGDIMDKAMIQYIGDKDAKVELMVRVRPEEEEFHSEEIRQIFPRVFVKQKILFEGENMEYKIYSQQGTERKLVQEGNVSCELPDIKMKDSRFACLNSMGLMLSLKEEESLRKRMQEYLERTATAEELFQLM